MKNTKIALLSTGIAYGILILFFFLSEAIKTLIPYRSLVAAGTFLYLPLIISKSFRLSLQDSGLNFRNLLFQLKDFFLISIWIYPFFLGLFIFYELWVLKFRFIPEIKVQYFDIIIFHFFGVSLPEEFFFRGFLLPLFDRDMPKKYLAFGVNWGTGLLLSSFFFSAGHLIFSHRLEKLAVFFPGLLFGLLREKHNSLLLPVLFHAISNIIVEIVESHFFP